MTKRGVMGRGCIVFLLHAFCPCKCKALILPVILTSLAFLTYIIFDIQTDPYEKCQIQPAGQIDLDLITREKNNLDRIVATLGLKEMTQGTLIRKLCTYTTANPTRQAVFEYDRLVRSIYTLKYLRDPQLERNIRRSQNRIESYHQLRAAVSKVGGKKELTGKNDLETEISNQCGRLISNAIVYYNSAILSRLLERLEAEGNDKGIEALTRISPVAWQHILLNGHYTFQSSNEIIDLDALVAGLKLG